MLEVEVKYRAPQLAVIRERLASLKAERLVERTDEDQYFNAPDRDFKKTDEAFRLRQIGNENRLTYKGPKLDTTTKTRTEIEIRIGDGEANAADAVRMLQALGYRSVAVVRKRRTVFHLERSGFNIEVCLDEVDGVGSYVEVEVVVDEPGYAAAKAAVLEIAAELGLTEPERRSYLGLLLAKESGETS